MPLPSIPAYSPGGDVGPDANRTSWSLDPVVRGLLTDFWGTGLADPQAGSPPAVADRPAADRSRTSATAAPGLLSAAWVDAS